MQGEAFYCPVLSPERLAKCLKKKTYRYNDDGDLERLCSVCRDFWPADTEFFYPSPGHVSGLKWCCRACFLDLKAAS